MSEHDEPDRVREALFPGYAVEEWGRDTDGHQWDAVAVLPSGDDLGGYGTRELAAAAAACEAHRDAVIASAGSPTPLGSDFHARATDIDLGEVESAVDDFRSAIQWKTRLGTRGHIVEVEHSRLLEAVRSLVSREAERLVREAARDSGSKRGMEQRIQDLEQELGCTCCNTMTPPCGCCRCLRHEDERPGRSRHGEAGRSTEEPPWLVETLALLADDDDKPAHEHADWLVANGYAYWEHECGETGEHWASVLMLSDKGDRRLRSAERDLDDLCDDAGAAPPVLPDGARVRLDGAVVLREGDVLDMSDGAVRLRWAGWFVATLSPDILQAIDYLRSRQAAPVLPDGAARIELLETLNRIVEKQSPTTPGCRVAHECVDAVLRFLDYLRSQGEVDRG